MPEAKKQEWISGREAVTLEMASKGKFSVNAGSGTRLFGSIGFDIGREWHPDVVADVRCIPFKSGVFEQAFFCEVIEHLPVDGDRLALKELNRVLCSGGELILTTPHDVPFYTFFDLQRYFITHHHYKKQRLVNLCREYGFEMEEVFTSGGIGTCLFVVYASFLGGVGKIFGHHYVPKFFADWMCRVRDAGYGRGDKKRNGYVVFIRARKDRNL